MGSKGVATNSPQQSKQTGVSQRLKVVAGIPCYKTESSIADVVSRARKHVDEVIVVDDGSPDGTAKVAEVAGAVVVNHLVNKGYGQAIKSCIKAAKDSDADILVTIDGDGQHNKDSHFPKSV